MKPNRCLFFLAALLLAGLTLVSKPASVFAQYDPQPPWQGKLVAQAEMFRFNPGANSMVKEADLPPNDPNNSTSTVGVYGLNAHWVSLSHHNHVVAANLVTFPVGTNLSVDPAPLWQGTALRSCTIYTLGASRTLQAIGTLPTVGGTVGVYAIGDGYAQISAWLHFVASDCLSGSFNQAIQPSIPTPASFGSGSTVKTVTIEEANTLQCDEPHEIERTETMSDGNTLVICKTAKLFQPMGGEVLLYGLGTVVTLASPIPGDEALVISAWVANAAKAGAVAVGVAASVASQASSAPVGSVHVAAEWGVPIDWAAEPPVWMSIRHPESPELIAELLRVAKGSRLLQQREQYPGACEAGVFNNGMICLYAGLNDPGNGQIFQGSVAILMGIGPKIAFVVVSGPVRPTPPMPGESGWMRLGQTQYYMQAAQVFYDCAWFMSNRISNGHGPSPDYMRLDAGAGWARWQEKKTRYNLVFPILEIALPPNPFG